MNKEIKPKAIKSEKIIVLILLLFLISNIAYAKQNTTKLRGLENAITKVKNPVAIEQLQRNIDKLAEKIHVVEIIEEKGETIVKAKKSMKFLGFIGVYREIKYTINSEGNLIVKRNIFDFLFKEITAKAEVN